MVRTVTSSDTCVFLKTQYNAISLLASADGRISWLMHIYQRSIALTVSLHCPEHIRLDRYMKAPCREINAEVTGIDIRRVVHGVSLPLKSSTQSQWNLFGMAVKWGQNWSATTYPNNATYQRQRKPDCRVDAGTCGATCCNTMSARYIVNPIGYTRKCEILWTCEALRYDQKLRSCSVFVIVRWMSSSVWPYKDESLVSAIVLIGGTLFA